MFASHTAQITVVRKEPSQEFDPDTASVVLARRFTELAERIVVGSLLKEPKEDNRKKRAQKKLADLYEKDERMRGVRDFMNDWNHWRDFYFNLAPMMPKTRGQLTIIENCIEYAKERNMSINMLIACVHKAYEKRKLKPNYNEILINGEDHYERYWDDVMADIDARDMEERAIKRV